MSKLVGSLLVAWLCMGCLSRAQHGRVVEAPDPVVGDLRCAAPRITLLEALYFGPSAVEPQRCESGS
jgi:hypothetical protein